MCVLKHTQPLHPSIPFVSQSAGPFGGPQAARVHRRLKQQPRPRGSLLAACSWYTNRTPLPARLQFPLFVLAACRILACSRRVQHGQRLHCPDWTAFRSIPPHFSWPAGLRFPSNSPDKIAALLWLSVTGTSPREAQGSRDGALVARMRGRLAEIFDNGAEPPCRSGERQGTQNEV